MVKIIEAKKIGKIYKDGSTKTEVLKNLSLSVEEGEFVAVMGPSGSGKSTLLHILGFLDTLTSGEYFFEGKNASSFSEAESAKVRNEKIGFVFQAFNLLQRTTVLENVKLPLLYSKVNESEWDSRARAALEAVEMTHRENHEPSELSGGEKQRVAIARALVTNPHVIFADEPTGNLDSRSGQIVMNILERLHDEKKHTIILITHETYTALHAERIIHIKDGSVEKEEKVEKRKEAVKFIK